MVESMGWKEGRGWFQWSFVLMVRLMVRLVYGQRDAIRAVAGAMIARKA